MFVLTEISRLQDLTIVAHNVNKTAVNRHQRGIDVGRGSKYHIKAGFASSGNRDLRHRKVGSSLAEICLENGIVSHPVDRIHGHTGGARFVADGVGDWSWTVVGDGYGVFAGEMVCVIEVDRRRCD